ncbi:MAG: hypothetical protein NC079_07135 [Clostridium sp.]|nr:hypothetical protein [Acetatifactor muris]MCM1527688.1 hypothetical protein [Bacteroides sp.]MCM1563368.1 hypothetical protein [Clostridium sp.]
MKDRRTGYQISGRRALTQDYGVLAGRRRLLAWAFFMVGGAGLLTAVLGLTGILPGNLSGRLPFLPDDRYPVYAILTTVSMLLVSVGVVLCIRAGVYAGISRAGNTLPDAVKQWCRDNLRAEEIDAAVGAGEDRGGTENSFLYFGRVKYLKERISRQFMNLDERLLDRYINETLYGMIFGEGED